LTESGPRASLRVLVHGLADVVVDDQGVGAGGAQPQLVVVVGEFVGGHVVLRFSPDGVVGHGVLSRREPLVHVGRGVGGASLSIEPALAHLAHERHQLVEELEMLLGRCFLGGSGVLDHAIQLGAQTVGLVVEASMFLSSGFIG